MAEAASDSAITSAPQPVTRVRMPSRIAGSFSTTTISAPSSGMREADITLAMVPVEVIVSVVGTVTEKCEPPPLFESSASPWLSTRAMRCTIDSPRPRPRAIRAPWSRR